MTKLNKLVEELVTLSGPQVVPGQPVQDWQEARKIWERHVKSLCGQIFMQGHGAGWDKHVAVVEQRERDFEEAHQYAKDTTRELNKRLAQGRAEAMEATACCVAHGLLVRWIPAPGWWIHDDNTTCTGCWQAPAPLQTGWLPHLPGYARPQW